LKFNVPFAAQIWLYQRRNQISNRVTVNVSAITRETINDKYR